MATTGIPQWAPGNITNPGDLRVPRSQSIVTQQQPNDNSFESGALTHWAVTYELGGAGAVTIGTTHAFDGTNGVTYAGSLGTGTKQMAIAVLTNDYAAPVTPGKVINFSCMIWRDKGNPNISTINGGCRIAWYTAGSVFISYSYATSPSPYNTETPKGMVGGLADKVWQKVSGTATAPPNAAFAKAVIAVSNNGLSGSVWADNFVWDYTFQGLPVGLSFVAVQAGVGTTGATEPVWPITAGATVVDNTVTWQAEFASRITWTAKAILKSGAVEPTWPTVPGGNVVDNPGSGYDISWVAVDGRITDSNCPQSAVVVAAQSKIYAANGDTIGFCATNNPLDWTTQFDAGFLPFGLQSFGSEPCAALGLYRSNLIASNSLGYQMWQIDPDPANMALLDAEPVGCTYPKSMAPVQNDLVFLTTKGIRSIGVTGQTGNLQAGQFGKNIDPLVIASIAGGLTPRGLFYPGTGQYWLCFGNTVYVMTNNGSGANSWSQYVFPSSIDAWTVESGVLLLRSGDLIWQVDEATLLDDKDIGGGWGGTNVLFTGLVQWPFLDFGPVGLDKNMDGIDLVCTGTGKINILYDQTNFALQTPDYLFSGDTLPGIGMLPFPMTAPSFSVALTFDGNQAWEWEVTTVYLNKLDSE